MKWLFGTLAGLIVLVLAIIGVQNPSLVTIRFLGWQTGVIPLWVILLVALVSGMLLVTLITIPGRIHRYRTTRRLQHQLAAATPLGAHEQPTDSTLRPIGAPAELLLPPVVQSEGAA